MFACGDNLNGGHSPRADAGVHESDAGSPDAAVARCPADPAVGEPGAPCVEDAECDSMEGAGDGRCLRGAKRGLIFPGTGYCVRICAEGATSCGSGTVCISQESFPMAVCMDACSLCGDPGTPGFYCSAGLACTNHIAGELVNAAACLPGDEMATIGTPCTSNAECPPGAICELDQSGTTGVCGGVNCVPPDSCNADDDSQCIDPDGEGGDPSFCIDPCEETADCATDDGQRCDEDGMFCRHSVIGDPCGADGDCGQPPWSCSPDSICTIPCGDGCPDGTVCNEGGRCEPA